MPTPFVERKEPSGVEAAGEDEIPSVSRFSEGPAEQEGFPDREPEFAGDSMADLPEKTETPEIALPEVLPSASKALTDEFAALPEPVFLEPEEPPETVAAPFPGPRPLLSGPLMMDEPSILVISQPAPELIQVSPASPVIPAQSPQPRPPAPAEPPARPRSEESASSSQREPQSRPQAAPAEPPAIARSGEPVSGIRRESLPLPTAPVPNLPARDPPVPPAPPPSDGEIEVSRIVRAAVGQTIEIPFQGTGWVYLGELRSQSGVAYNSRRSDSEGQTFVFQVEEAGTFGLKFYKQDYIRDYILNDHVQVIVNEAPEREPFSPSRNRVISAPRWPYLPSEAPSAETAAGSSRPEDPPVGPAVPSGEAAAPQTPAGRRPPALAVNRDDSSIVPVAPPRAVSPPEEQSTLSEDDGSGLPEDTQPEEYFRKAKEAFEGGQIQPALAILGQFRERYP
ncbi:MAG: hypothetical protein LBP81_08400, partial [Treponema sp.]|nr:hypothetical protein [Treponema sp.]